MQLSSQQAFQKLGRQVNIVFQGYKERPIQYVFIHTFEMPSLQLPEYRLHGF
jgi:hypothetical protein